MQIFIYRGTMIMRVPMAYEDLYLAPSDFVGNTYFYQFSGHEKTLT
jgi:hypothetical protein